MFILYFINKTMKIIQLDFYVYFHILKYHKTKNIKYQFGCSSIKKFFV